MFNIENFFRINLREMASNLSDGIEYETATENAKRKGTYIIMLFYVISIVSIRGYT